MSLYNWLYRFLFTTVTFRKYKLYIIHFNIWHNDIYMFPSCSSSRYSFSPPPRFVWKLSLSLPFWACSLEQYIHVDIDKDVAQCHFPQVQYHDAQWIRFLQDIGLWALSLRHNFHEMHNLYIPMYTLCTKLITRTSFSHQLWQLHKFIYTKKEFL